MSALSRRSLLAFGTATTGVLVAAWHGVGQLGTYPALPFPARTLTPKTAAIYQLLGDFHVPPGGPLPGSGGDRATLLLIDEVLTFLPDHHSMLLQALALAFEHGTALDRFGAQRLTRMSERDRHDFLDRWARSEDLIPAQLYAALRIVFDITYFERTDVQLAMGIPMLCPSERFETVLG